MKNCEIQVGERLPLEEIERSLRITYRKKIWAKFFKAVKEFNLVEDGDKIAVGISGGKDSLLLAKLFQELAKDRSRKFEVVFISMDPGFNKENLDNMKANLEYLGIPCEIYEGNVFKIVEEFENPCFMCAKMRRGSLYNKLEELGCNKLALGHHFDDVIETTLINMMYAGTLKTMLPKAKSESGELQLIRPLFYVKEEDIINYTKRSGIKAMDCGCVVATKEEGSKRAEVKNLLKNLSQVDPDIKQRIFNSMRNINLNFSLGFEFNKKKYSYLEDIKISKEN